MHIPIMDAARAARANDVSDDEILDVNTSAAILRWMETGVLPDGIPADEWERWIEAGCRRELHARGVPLTAAMLGHWARSGTLG